MRSVRPSTSAPPRSPPRRRPTPCAMPLLERAIDRAARDLPYTRETLALPTMPSVSRRPRPRTDDLESMLPLFVTAAGTPGRANAPHGRATAWTHHHSTTRLDLMTPYCLLDLHTYHKGDVATSSCLRLCGRIRCYSTLAWYPLTASFRAVYRSTCYASSCRNDHGIIPIVSHLTSNASTACNIDCRRTVVAAGKQCRSPRPPLSVAHTIPEPPYWLSNTQVHLKVS